MSETEDLETKVQELNNIIDALINDIIIISQKTNEIIKTNNKSILFHTNTIELLPLGELYEDED